ncbi:MAG: GNAT family N-acetyltransferase [[Ruminococcus] gnavus]|nr:GNAT family N-acetyltransferase [Mediterraneibacter gnavus]
MNMKIDRMIESDMDEIVKIYNSNTGFLKNHMGVESVSKEIVINDLETMKRMGFQSFSVRDEDGSLIGICEFKMAEEVYLSLLLIDGNKTGKGYGSDVYHQLERKFKEEGAKKVLIDVVCDYEDYVVAFWEKQGFVPCGNIQLEWNGYHSKAVKMEKEIG